VVGWKWAEESREPVELGGKRRRHAKLGARGSSIWMAEETDLSELRFGLDVDWLGQAAHI